uniref:Nucleoporin NUP35 n=1 Tax=Glossina pallidipes TaxID=7398 RepID=A0A1A9Z4Z1_GLOPL
MIIKITIILIMKIKISILFSRVYFLNPQHTLFPAIPKLSMFVITIKKESLLPMVLIGLCQANYTFTNASMEPMNLGSPESPDTNLYLPSFLMDETQTPTTSRSNTRSRNKLVGRNLPFGCTNSPGGVASSTQNYSTRPALGQKTLFGGYRQTPTWGQNASRYIGTPAPAQTLTSTTGPPVQGLFDSLRNETNQVQTPLRTQQSYTPPFDRSYVGQRNKNSALNQGKQQHQLVNVTGPLRHSLLSNNTSQALQCEGQTPHKGFWVTVYGFPATAISTILQTFSQCGTIMDKIMPSQNGNWVHLKYSSRLECDKALNYNEKILANNIMIAVTRCKDKDLLDKENFPDNSMDSAKARPLSQGGYKDTQRYASGPNYICGIRSSAGLVDKFLDLFFVHTICIYMRVYIWTSSGTFSADAPILKHTHHVDIASKEHTFVYSSLKAMIKWRGIATPADRIFYSISKYRISKESNFGMKAIDLDIFVSLPVIATANQLFVEEQTGYQTLALADKSMSIAICVPSGISTPLLRRKSPDARRNTMGTGAKRRIASLITISVYCIRSSCSIVISSSIN